MASSQVRRRRIQEISGHVSETIRKYLCLFSSEPLRQASCFATAGATWSERTEFGRCELTSHILDGDASALGVSGLFSAVTALVQPADLEGNSAAYLREGLPSFLRPGAALELVAVDSPIQLIRWVATEAPRLLPFCRQDGDVRPESVSWWRQRAEILLAESSDPGNAPVGDSPDIEAEELRAFVARRRGRG